MSALMGSGALALWLDVAPELDRETDGWYVDEHLPERIDIGGYLRARRFVAIEGRPAYLTLFEAQTPATLASEGYLRLVGKLSEQSKRIRAGFSNVVRGTFKVRQSLGRGIGGVMASVHLRPHDPARADVAVAALDKLVPQLLRRHGIIGVHLLEPAPEVRARMDRERVTGHQDARVDHVLFVEATRAAEVAAIRRDILAPDALATSGCAEENYGVYILMYEVSGLNRGVDTILGDRR
jgi:hypothetical protein